MQENSVQHQKPSNYLILLSAVILCLGLVMAYLVNATIDNLKYDAGLINKTGFVRGSIQRVTKLVLSDTNQSPDKIIADINLTLGLFAYVNNENWHSESKDNVLQSMQNLKRKWFDLELKLVNYAENPSEQGRAEIIELSEQCWNAADELVLATQLASEHKVSNIKLFYVILILNVVSAILVISLLLSYARKKLEYESLHDPLTLVDNRRSYNQAITSEIDRSKRYRQPMSLILFDIDDFKDINDEHGHKAGDSVLIDLTRVVLQSIRQGDTIFRIGGEEFAILAPGTDEAGAFKLSEKVRIAVEDYAFQHSDKVTISLGVAETGSQISRDELYSNADMALYYAKNNGKNRTGVYTQAIDAV